jgi:hypothetical protein
MKTVINLKTLLAYLGGIITGAVLFVHLSSPANDGPPPQGSDYSPVNTKIANALHQRYLDGAKPMNTVFHAFTINKSQFEAMKVISRETTGVYGFRIYPGLDAEKNTVGIIVAVTEEGKDDTTHGIFRSSSVNAGPCPILCDTDSQIGKR